MASIFSVALKSSQISTQFRWELVVALSDIRYDKVAQGMNCYGERIVEPSEITPALRRAVDSGLPAVLDVEIDREAIPPDYEILASIWLEGCELPKKVEEAKEILKEKVSEAVASA